MEKFVIVRDSLRKIRRFNLMGRTVEFKIKSIPAGVQPVTWVQEAVKDAFAYGTRGAEPSDQVGFSFCSKEFARGGGWMRFKPFSQVTTDDVWNVISGIYQSNSTGFSTETFCLGITTVKLPKGKGKGRSYNGFNEECAMRRGIISINNKDNLCLPRALVVAKAYVDKDCLYTKIRKDTGKIQTSLTLELVQHAGVSIDEEGCGIPELEMFQKHLQNYKIVVYEYGNKGRNVIYEGCIDSSKRLNLLHHKGHYNTITSLTAAFCCVYYCEKCHVAYNNKNDHRCSGKCPGCFFTPACLREQVIRCAECKRVLRGQACFDNHRKEGSYNKSTVCKEIRRCDECFKTIRGTRAHTCGETFCKICNAHVPTPHYCYMPVDSGTPTMKKCLFIFYDLESTQEKLMEDGSLLHEPNLCVFRQCCEHCLDTQLSVCSECGVRQNILQNNPISRFMEFILNQRKLFKKVYVIGHASGQYDMQFVLNYILNNTDLKPQLITRGTKLMSMDVGNVKFLDSLNYFPMPLSKLPKIFGFDAKKGYFPFLFNIQVHQSYVGPLPPLDYFNVDNLKGPEREALIKWHTELSNQDYTFDFQKEIIEYCVSDVDILTRASLKFRELMLSEGNVDPFTEAITLPGVCNKIFRRNFLKPNMIGIIPKNGYRWKDNQSKIGVQWLLWEEHQRAINIIHAAKQEEVVVAGLRVDGYCPETQQVFEFHGCYYHGCPRCIKYKRTEPCYEDLSITPESRYEATVEKTERLRQRGYEVIEKWECDFRKEITPEIESYVENHPLIVNIPLNPRDAFYGGRTGPTKLYYKCKDDEKIKYVDVCSLYPWVNKYGKYPVGHPELFVGEECNKLNLKETDGLIKCKVLPPQALYHPILPVKTNSKLMFPLCRACCESMNNEECNHDSENERALVGTWVIDEVLKAVQKGYKILNIYEVWKYTVVQYDPITKSGGLFAEYISKFLKIKQQASGWPIGCDNTEKMQAYISEYFGKEGVELNYDEIDHNPGRRQIGKSVITSFWGKFAQKENAVRASIVTDPGEFFDMLSKPSITVNDVLPINENTLVVNWAFKEESYDVLPTVNVALAAYTTAQARLKLYSYLELLGERVLYYDTDSVIYISRPGEYEVPIGSFLGEMTDELEENGKGSFITEFVSGGPKLYSYRIYSPESDSYHDVIKVKGITVNYKTSQQVNFEKLRDMILNEAPPEYINTINILRTREHEVITKETSKIFRVNFRKRRRVDNYDSVPFGYKKQRLS